MNKVIYLDYAATTPVDTRVIDKMMACISQTGAFGNPSSLHHYGQMAREAVEYARNQVAAYLHAEASELIFTSGATEAINLAIKGAASLYQKKGKHIITMKTEHKAVLDTCQYLEKTGYRVTYLSPNPAGLLPIDDLKAAIQPDTVLVSLMHVNNETGVFHDLDAIAAETRSRGILLHVDAAQTPGKLSLDVTKTPIDLISLCAHKVYGPKGIGALYLRKRPRVRVAALLHGGGHEQGMRSGTLATHQIVGMGEAFELARMEMDQDNLKIKQHRSQLLTGLSELPGFTQFAKHDQTVPHILNFGFNNTFSEVLMKSMPQIAVSAASACQGKTGEGSYVLKAMGHSEAEIKSAIRLSLGRMTSAADIEAVSSCFKNIFLPRHCEERF